MNAVPSTHHLAAEGAPLVEPTGHVGLLGLSTWTLVGAGIIEVLLYRVLRPLVAFDGQSFPAWLQLGLSAGAAYALNLVWVLGLLVVSGRLHQHLRETPAEHRAGRLALCATGALFVGISLLSGLAPGWAEQAGLIGIRLFGTFTCAALLTALSVVPTRASLRFKLGMVLVMAPLLLQFAAYYGAARAEGIESSHADLLQLGQGVAIGAAVLVPLCFVPDLQRREVVFAGIITLLVGVAAAWLIWLDWQTAAQIIQSVTGLRLPLGRPGQAAAICGLCCLAFSVLVLLVRPQPQRTRGVGLLLLGLAGYQLQEGPRMVLFLAGLLSVVRGY